MEIINLNLIPEKFSPVVHASQLDAGRVTRFKLYNGPIPFQLSGQESIKLRVRKPNGQKMTIPVQNTSADYVDISTTEEITSESGKVYCKLRIDNLGAKSFYYLVDPKP